MYPSGCKRSCTPEAMAASISKFSHFVREFVVGKPAELTIAQKVVEATEEAKDIAELQKEKEAEESKDFGTMKGYTKLKRKMMVDATAALTKRMRIGLGDFGKYSFEQRLNVDQVPFNLDNNASRSFFNVDDEKCQITGQSGADKRFGTLQVIAWERICLKCWNCKTKLSN